MPFDPVSPADTDTAADAFLQGLLSLGLEPNENPGDKAAAISVLGSMIDPSLGIDGMADAIRNAPYNGLAETPDDVGSASGDGSFGETGTVYPESPSDVPLQSDSFADAFIQGFLSLGLSPEQSLGDEAEAIRVLGGMIDPNQSIDSIVKIIEDAPYNGIVPEPVESGGFGEVDPGSFDDIVL